ncbi:MAG: hypothetical protein ACO1N0_14730 [Fluviicola sp.]
MIQNEHEETYFAQNISVKDQLGAELNWTTFKPGCLDCDYITTI